MSTSSPRKKLPVNPSIEHLQKQAKRRSKENPSVQLATVQFQLAQEYGCKNWPELVQMVASMSRPNDPHRDRRFDAMPKAARAGDFEVVQRMVNEGEFTPLTLDQTLAHVLWYGDDSTWPKRKAAADFLLEHSADPSGQYGSAGYGPIVFGTAECIQPEALAWLIEKGADVTSPPVETKYGPQCILSHLLGTYNRSANERKHRCIDLLLNANAYVPPEVSPAVLAIHRGHAAELNDLLDWDAGLVERTFLNMPYGNIRLAGGTLLHCAVEFDENKCIEVLLKHGADINKPADPTNGIGGQTPIFHAIATLGDGNFPTLRLLSTLAEDEIDMSVRATFYRFDKPLPHPMTPVEFAEYALSTDSPGLHKTAQEELAYLRTFAAG